MNLTELWLNCNYSDEDSVVNYNSYLSMIHDILPVNIEWSNSQDLLFVIFKSNRIAVFDPIAIDNVQIVQTISDLKSGALLSDNFGTNFINSHSQIRQLSYDANEGLLVIGLWNGDILLNRIKTPNMDEHLNLSEFQPVKCDDMATINKILIKNKRLIVLQKEFFVVFILIRMNCDGSIGVLNKCHSRHDAKYKITNLIDLTDQIYLVVYQNGLIQILSLNLHSANAMDISYLFEFKLNSGRYFSNSGVAREETRGFCLFGHFKN
jgi:hypothetical protein